MPTEDQGKFADVSNLGRELRAALVDKGLITGGARDLPSYGFNVADHRSYRLLVALLQSYQIRPYRYARQRHTTIMAKVPPRFVNESLPESISTALAS